MRTNKEYETVMDILKDVQINEFIKLRKQIKRIVGEKMISYYELLSMIKDKTIPDEVIYHNLGKSIKYKATYDSVDSSFDCYVIKNKDDENEDFKYFLSDCMLESSMFDKCIEVVDDMPEHIPNQLIQSIKDTNTKCLAHKINEIINYLQKENKNDRL